MEESRLLTHGSKLHTAVYIGGPIGCESCSSLSLTVHECRKYGAYNSFFGTAVIAIPNHVAVSYLPSTILQHFKKKKKNQVSILLEAAKVFHILHFKLFLILQLSPAFFSAETLSTEEYLNTECLVPHVQHDGKYLHQSAGIVHRSMNRSC